MTLSQLPAIVAAFVPMVVLVIAITIDRNRCQQTEKSPQQEKLLRPAGYSLALRLDDLCERILCDFLLACGLCGIAGAAAVAVSALYAANVAMFYTVLAAVLFVTLASFGTASAVRAFRRLNEARNIRLGLRGEQAVAEALHEVADCGFRAFHDLPGGKDWNIDHIAVGTRGVFLIETKARRRRRSRNGQPEHVVIYDGKVLKFPFGYDEDAVPQAERNARWLAEFLSKRTAEPVTVEALVVLPGWYVDPRGNFPVKAMPASYLVKFLRGQRERLQPAHVSRIVAALDDKCRDLEF